MSKNPALIAELMKSVHWTPVRSEGGIFLGHAPVFPIDRPRIQIVIEKIVKGLYYHHNKRRLPSDQVVTPFLYNPTIEKQFQEAIASLPLYNVGDGSVFSYRYLMGDGSSPMSYWFFMFYNDTTFIITRTLLVSTSQVGASTEPTSTGCR